MSEKMLTIPTGADFRRYLRVLGAEYAEKPDQIHVDMMGAGRSRGPDFEAAWQNIAGHCHMRDLKPLGYLYTKTEGRRILRVILSERNA